MRTGLIGYGNRGAVLAELLRSLPTDELIAIGDADSQARSEAARVTGLPTFDSTLSLWPETTPDLAVIATPPENRARLIERVADSGVRCILTEKPLALSLTDADWIITACESRGVLLSVGQHFRSCPELHTLKRLIQSGELGRIESIQALGFGSLLDQGWHLLDAARWLLNGPRVLWAAAQGTSDRDLIARLGDRLLPDGSAANHGSPAWITAQLALEGDVRVWLESGPLCQKSGAPLGDWHERRLRVQGSNGVAECRPGHYLRAWCGESDPLDVRLDPASLESASRLMLLELLDAVQTGGELPNPARDARATLEGLLLCLQSLREQSVAVASQDDRKPAVAISAPPLEGRAPIQGNLQPTIAPRFSVLIPLIEDRGFGEACLQGWLKQEVFPAAAYELLLLDDGTRGDLTERLQPHLRAQDRILTGNDAVRPQLYNLGGEAARGEYLVLTESHCIPEPDFLRELDRYLSQTSFDGACCRSIPVCYNELARADAHAFETGFREFRRDGDWRKVNVHAFALKREVFLQVGGFEPRYELFSEMVLAARLRDAGVPIGYAAGAAVQHHYRVDISELIEYIEGFVRGELQYRLDYGSAEPVGFSHLDTPAQRVENLPALQTCLQAEWRRVRREIRRCNFSSLPQLLSLGVRRLKAGRFAQLKLNWDVWFMSFRCRLWQWHAPSVRRFYASLFYTAVANAFLHCERSGGLKPQERMNFDFPITDLTADWLIGFYLPEQEQGRAFRWTHPVAGIDLPIPAGEYEIRIDCGGIRPWPASLVWNLNGRELPSTDVEYDADCCRLRVSVPPRRTASRVTLGLSCLPWDVNDQRRLGLPIFAIHCQRQTAASDPGLGFLPFTKPAIVEPVQLRHAA